MRKLNKKMSVFGLFFLLMGFCPLFGMYNNVEKRKGEVLEKFKKNIPGSLTNERICFYTEKAPEETVPFPGAGDEFGYYPIVGGKAIDLGANISISPKSFLTKGFDKCSPFNVIAQNKRDDYKNSHVFIDIRDALDAMGSNLDNFESPIRYIDESEKCKWARSEVEKVQKNMEEIGTVPLFCVRAASAPDPKYREVEAFEYMFDRSMSLDDFKFISKHKPEGVSLYNMYFEDRTLYHDENGQETKMVDGSESPIKLYKDYRNNGPFVGDFIVLAAALRHKKLKGHYFGACTGPTNLAPFCTDKDDKEKSVSALLAKKHNQRWHKKCFNKNVSLVIQNAPIYYEMDKYYDVNSKGNVPWQVAEKIDPKKDPWCSVKYAVIHKMNEYAKKKKAIKQ